MIIEYYTHATSIDLNGCKSSRINCDKKERPQKKLTIVYCSKRKPCFPIKRFAIKLNSMGASKNMFTQFDDNNDEVIKCVELYITPYRERNKPTCDLERWSCTIQWVI